MPRSLILPAAPSRSAALGRPRRPDLSGLLAPARPSARPLVHGECDYDELTIHRAWRVVDPNDPGSVRYFMYEYSQTLPGETVAWHGYKAVRLIRLTRVPRYLRFTNAQAGHDLVFEQMRDVLVGLRERDCRFLQIIAKSPELPLVFSYGVQAIGATPEEAQALADESYAVLELQLNGTYQQLLYQSLTPPEGELLARYQSTWGELAMARGRPIPAGNTLSTGAILSDGRTDVESTNNQLESFIRGMTDRSFMLTLVTTPISPAEMNLALRNIAQHVTAARSDVEGSRGVSAGVAMPLAVGATAAATHGANHATSLTHTDGTSTSLTHTDGTSTSHADTVGTSTGHTHTAGVNHGVNESQGTNQSTTNTTGTSTSHTEGTSQSTTEGTSQAVTNGTSESTTTGTNQSTTVTQSTSTTHGTNHTTTDGTSASTTNGSASSLTAGNSQSASSTSSTGTSLTGTESTGSSSGVHAGVPGIGGTSNSSSGNSLSSGQSNTHGTGATDTNSASATNSTSTASTDGTSRSVAAGTSDSTTTGTSVSTTTGSSESSTVGSSHSTTDTTSQSETNGTFQSNTEGQFSSVGQTQGTSATEGTSAGTSNSNAASSTQSASTTDGTGTNQSTAVGTGTAATRGTADTYMTTLASSAGQASSLGVSPFASVNISRRTFDSAKSIIANLLEAQQARYLEGVKSGAFYYQMFLQTPDRATLVGAAGLLKSAFWGDAGAAQLPQPFSVYDVFGSSEADHEAEKRRLLAHARVLTQYAKREHRSDLIEPYFWSSYLTPTEAAAFTHPPTAESIGLLAVHDSMPVLAMPSDRADRDVYLGRLIWGERAQRTDQRYGFDIDEIVHLLITGMTGFGKTTTLMRILTELVALQRPITIPPTPRHPVAETRVARASVLGFDWAQNMRNLATIVEPERFRFYSIRKPRLGAFRWNPLAIPGGDITPSEWLNALADNFMASMNFGAMGRSVVVDALSDLYRANRLAPFVLRPAVTDEAGTVLRPAEILAPVDRATLPAGAIVQGENGVEYANVMTCPELSRLVSMSHLATIVAARAEALATVEAARLHGTSMRDYVQTVWMAVAPYARGGDFDMITCDPSLDEKVCLQVGDLIDPDRGLVTIVETEGLDFTARRFILGSVVLAVYRHGLARGEGVFDHDHRGPGAYIVLEEAHELFGAQGEADDRESLATRTALYESLFRRCRALGIRLVTLVQNPASIPSAVTSNTSAVIVHTTTDDKDRDKVFSMLNWSKNLTQQLREWRYLGEMAKGEAIVRLPARTNWLEATPVLVQIDSPELARVPDESLAHLSRAASTAG